MKPPSGHFSETSGLKSYTNQQKIDIINIINKGKTNTIPNTIAQIDHIFRDDDGHLLFSEENVNTISKLINNTNNIVLDEDKHGNTWYSSNQSDGTQLWAKVHDNKLSDAGKNDIPREANHDTGLDNNKNIKEGE